MHAAWRLITKDYADLEELSLLCDHDVLDIYIQVPGKRAKEGSRLRVAWRLNGQPVHNKCRLRPPLSVRQSKLDLAFFHTEKTGIK